MRTAVPEKILKIIADIETKGNASLTRRTVLKKWFGHPGRLPAFGLWVARRAAGRPGKTKGEHDALLREAGALLGPASTRESVFAQPDRRAAEDLHTRAKAAQNEFENQQWGPVRIVHCWPLLLVEEGLDIYVRHADSPSHGYKLAADWAQNYDSRHGNGLNGPSRGKLHELVRFMFAAEAIEEDEVAKRASPAEMAALSADVRDRAPRATRSYAIMRDAGAPPLRVTNESRLQHGSENGWVSVEKYLTGKVVNAGGKQDPNVHLVLSETGESVRVGATEQQLGGERENQLYKSVTLRVQAEQHLRTHALRNIRLIQFLPQAGEADERALAAFWQKSREATGWGRRSFLRRIRITRSSSPSGSMRTTRTAKAPSHG